MIYKINTLSICKNENKKGQEIKIMEKQIAQANGKLGILVVGVGGAVATTMITGVLAARKGLAKPIGSISQMAKMKTQDGVEKLIKDIVPLTKLEDIVFGGWDIFPENAYEAACYAEVLKDKDICKVKDELEAIKPMPTAFDHNWAKRLNGTHIKKTATRWDMVEQLREDIRKYYGQPARKSIFRKARFTLR